MSGYRAVLRLLFKNMFRVRFRRQGKGKAGAIALLVLVGIFIVAMIAMLCFMIAIMAVGMREAGALAEMLAVTLAAGCLIILTFGLVPMLAYLYFSRDTEFLMSLPVSTKAIFAARMTVVYVTEAAVALAVIIPATITAGVMLGEGAVFYISLILGSFIVPAVPFLLAAVISVPLMYIVSFFRNKGAFTSFALILLFAGLYVSYFMLIGRPSSSDSAADTDFIGAAAGITRAANVLFPLYALTRLAVMSPHTMFGTLPAAGAAAVNLAIFLISSVLFAAAAVGVSALAYSRGAKKMLEGGSAHSKKRKSEPGRSLTGALFRKEWRGLVRTPAFAFQVLSVIVICPIVVGFVNFMPFTNAAEADIAAMGFVRRMMSSISVGLICVFCVTSSVTGSGTSVTREGKKLAILKSMPVSFRAVVRAKLLLYSIISAVAVTVALAVLSAINFSLVNVVCGALFLYPFSFGYNCCCMYNDLRRPRLNWTSANEAVKNNRNVTVPMLVGIAISSVVMIAVVMISVMDMGRAYLPVVASVWGVLIAGAIIFAVLARLALVSNADYLASDIEA